MHETILYLSEILIQVKKKKSTQDKLLIVENFFSFFFLCFFFFFNKLQSQRPEKVQITPLEEEFKHNQ